MPKIIGKDQGSFASLAGLKLAGVDSLVKLGLPEAWKKCRPHRSSDHASQMPGSLTSPSAFAMTCTCTRLRAGDRLINDPRPTNLNSSVASGLGGRGLLN